MVSVATGSLRRRTLCAGFGDFMVWIMCGPDGTFTACCVVVSNVALTFSGETMSRYGWYLL